MKALNSLVIVESLITSSALAEMTGLVVQ